jgi:hypothetical protein
MIDLLMFSDMADLEPSELRKLGLWGLSNARIGEKHASQILAIFTAHSAMRSSKHGFFKMGRAKLALASLERRPLTDPVLLSQAAWLNRDVPPRDEKKAQKYVQQALAALKKEDQSQFPAIYKAARAHLKAELLRPDRNEKGSWHAAAQAYDGAARLYEQAGDERGKASCLEGRKRCKKPGKRPPQGKRPGKRPGRWPGRGTGRDRAD